MNNLIQRSITGILLVGMSILFFIFAPAWMALIALFGVLLFVLCAEWPRFNLWWLTPWYPVLPFLACIDLYLTALHVLAWMVCIVAAYDTGAYFCGTFFGSTRIAPAISPGKTVEGLIGGIVFSLLINFLYIFFLQNPLYCDIITTYLLAALGSCIAFFGDLFESYLKRNAKLKDSGFLLPGHGGVLDRIDGLLFVAFVTSFYVNYGICMKNILFCATILAAGFSSLVYTAESQPMFTFTSLLSSYDDSDLAEIYRQAKECKENYSCIGYHPIKSIDLAHAPFCITGTPAKITRGFGSEATVSQVPHVSKKYKCPKKDDSKHRLPLISREDVENFRECNNEPTYYGIKESSKKITDTLPSPETINDNMVFMSILFGQYDGYSGSNMANAQDGIDAKETK